MAKYTDAKCRLCRREGVKLYLKGARCFSPKCPIERRGAQVPGVHGKRRSRRLSQFGLQLREKQKTKRLYSVLEKQFQRYYQQALQATGNTGLALLQQLETRLDNVVYRLGFTASRSLARQLVSHGNVLVDDQKVDVASYHVKPGQIITLSPRALKFNFVSAKPEEKFLPPAWLQRKAAAGTIKRLPERKEITEDINESLIIEYYSR